MCIVCESKQSACEYNTNVLLQNVLSQQYDKHPIIILKDVKYAELRAMMDYMYRGEVNISQDQLAALLKAAESLQIKGLSDNKPSRPPSRPAQAAPAHPPRAPSPPPQVHTYFLFLLTKLMRKRNIACSTDYNLLLSVINVKVVMDACLLARYLKNRSISMIFFTNAEHSLEELILLTTFIPHG